MARNKKRGDVEVYCDAGNRKGVGSWAVHAMRKDGRGGVFERSGPLKGNLDNSELCEVRAVANSLHCLVVAKLIEPNDLVVVRCDNRGVVLKVLNPPAKPPSKEGLRLIFDCAKWIRDLADKEGFRLSIRHVKGHQPAASTDRDAIGNRRADELASLVFSELPKKPRKILPSVKRDRIKQTVLKLTTGKAFA